jgi:hypothetical protein
MGKIEITIEMVKNFLTTLTEEEKSEIRELMGIKTPLVGTVGKSRSTGKFIRTDKVYENNLNKQLSVLIKSLPTDQGLTVDEWGKKSVENGLQTQQEPIRIVGYYKKQLMEMGFVEVSE